MSDRFGRNSRRTRTDGASRRLRRRSVKRGVAVVATVGMMTGLLAAGAGAESSGSSATPKTGASTANDLKVVIGKTVALTTDQAGKKTPFNLMLINGQISGSGSGQVKIPTGPDSAKTVDVQSKPGQVQNLLDLGGSYNGDLPVTISTAVKVNGKDVDPNKAYGLNGDVEVTYTFVNHTARKQKITYKDIYGDQVTKETEIPVPFGNSFSVNFGEGWSVKDTGGMSADVTPTGTALGTSVILFPIIEGVVGGTTQTVTVKAQADNASLPSTKNTMVPVQLGSYMGGILVELEPAIQQSLMEPLNSVVGDVAGNIFSLASLISGYTGGFESLATNYIDPLVKEVDQVNVNPKQLTAGLTRLGSGLEDLGGLMVANQAAQDRVAGIVRALARAVGTNVPELVEWLGNVVEELGPGATQGAKGLRDLKTMLDGLNFGGLAAASATMDTACTGVGPTADFYGYQGNVLQSGGKGANSLNDVLDANTNYWNPSKTPAWVKTLRGLQAALDNQAAGTLIPKSLWLTLNGPLNPLPANITEMLQAPACQTVGTIADNIAPLAASWPTLGPVVGELATALDALAAIAKSPEAAKVYNTTLGALQRLSKLLSNDQCTVSEVINPIVNAINRYGASGISSHIEEVLAGVFNRCGLAQIIEYFGDVDALIGRALSALGQIVLAARADVPTIAKGVDGVKGLTDVVGAAFDAIPGVGAEVGNLIAGGGELVEGGGTDLISKLSSYTAELGATMNAMNERVLAGDGAPYGAATGVPGTVTMTAYQITMEEAAPNSRNWSTSLILAIIFLIVGVGVGTVIYRRHRKSRVGSTGIGG